MNLVCQNFENENPDPDACEMKSFYRMETREGKERWTRKQVRQKYINKYIILFTLHIPKNSSMSLFIHYLGKPQKKLFFSGPATKGGGNGLATKKKELFLSSKKIPNKNVATKLESGWGLVRP